MSVEHVNIADPYIHKTKGVAAATSGQLLKASSGDGIWEFENYVLNLHVEDISTAGSIYVVAPFAATITNGWSVIKNAITVANNVATLKIAGVSVTNGVITIVQAGSAAGQVNSCTPTALNAVTAGQAIEIAYGGSTTACKATFTLLLRRTA